MVLVRFVFYVFVFKQKTAYEMRISDWSSDVCSSDLLELGYALLALVSGENGHRLTDQIKGLRRQLAGEMGFVLPSVRIQDNMQLPANGYVLRVKEIESGQIGIAHV